MVMTSDTDGTTTGQTTCVCGAGKCRLLWGNVHDVTRHETHPWSTTRVQALVSPGPSLTPISQRPTRSVHEDPFQSLLAHFLSIGLRHVIDPSLMTRPTSPVVNHLSSDYAMSALFDELHHILISTPHYWTVGYVGKYMRNSVS